MTRLEKLLRNWGVSSVGFKHGLKQQRVCVDFGSAMTKVIVDGKFFMQPTCLIQHQQSSSVIAIGEKAELLGTTLPKDATLIYPVQNGKVVNSQVLEQFLQVLLEPYLRHDLSSFFTFPRVSCASVYVDQSSQSAACSKLLHHWAHKTTVTPTAEALWTAAQQQHVFADRGCVIDIGAMTTKFFILNGGKLAASYVVGEGGSTLTKDIQHLLRQEYHCDVGWQTAESCKKMLARFAHHEHPDHSHRDDNDKNNDKKLQIHGKDVFSSLPVSREAEAKKLVPALEAFLQRTISGFAQVCQSSSPECIANIQASGIFLSGGGSQVSGFSSQLEKKLGIKVTQSLSPQRDIVQGLWAR